ncbi:nuclear transport factor 2 family protein [Streptomyces sp. DSM 44915]|uniref:Nuclear transport factor 2 family protein n=1 Tax=Streptomyces chisholmiae TaxID=3075540 RepID=A0ABU2JLZ6_9ACTN|nr:nuclear transport factor 2 family protein [Streptomyces sp. DSM 44915]MDT0265549.1 nuclear transport factor 2 family protein [Streptomyces sp. DSM 44915]
MDTPPAQPLSDLDRLLAERACERVVLDLVHRLDLGEPATAAELFTPDGIWEWPAGGRRIVGREALCAYFGGRPADRLSRRLMSNIRITAHAADRASGTSYLATHRVDGHRGELPPPGPPTQVGHYVDVFERHAGSWLLARRTLHLAFGTSTPRLP